MLPPGGVLTERLQWHAGKPDRERLTCGWNYVPLAPGAYRLSIHEPVLSNAFDVRVTPAEPCRATCTSTPGTLALPFSRYPKLARVGGAVRVDAPGYVDPVCGQSTLLLAHAADGIVAVAGACTDGCCPAEFGGADFQCPWCKRTHPLRGDKAHSGWRDSSETYSLDGGPEGPNTTVPGLPRLDLCEDECGVVVRPPSGLGDAGRRF